MVSLMAEKKKMLEVSFTGKELLNNEVFDTTSEIVAKENNIFNKDKKYGPMTIITGEKELLDSVEKELNKMKKGEEKVVKLDSKSGFGERKSDLVRVVPIKVFQEQKMNPVPGLVVQIGNNLAKVQSVSGGRVRLDFNHPLAGRELEYTVKVEEEITDKKSIASKIFEKYFSAVPGAKSEWKEDKLYITLPEDTMKGLDNITKTISKLATDLGTKIEFKKGPKLKDNKEEKK
jgi:FKBP-type peptidyl-prolyl cis-trans isomerase 2